MLPDLSKAQPLFLDGKTLTIELVNTIAVARDCEFNVQIGEAALLEMNRSREFVLNVIKEERPIYGINTGFGALASKQIATSDLAALQLNLIRSHCTGVGVPFSREITRAIMLLRANCLCSGFSGVNPEIVHLLLAFINYGITPVVPSQGSVGASGDLAPLSHIALALIGEGEVEFGGKVMRADFVIHHLGLHPAKLGPKDGLALINGTAVMTALGALGIQKADQLMKLADVAAALTLDGIKGTIKAYDRRIQNLKPHKGQIATAANIRRLVEGSDIIDAHPFDNKVQDPYSLRCIPQVHGACKQTLAHARAVIETELNAVTDNPLIFVDDGVVISGGNFHGEAIAMAMDYLAIGLSEIASIAERRIEKMMNPSFSELPAFLTKDSGLNSGLMIAHVTAAALVSENKTLAHPASVDSVPTSTDKEDHVSMGVWAGRKLHQILFNVKQVLAIELLCNTQALEFQRPLKTSPVLEMTYARIRSHVWPIGDDRPFYRDIENIVRLIDNNELIKLVEDQIGALE